MSGRPPSRLQRSTISLAAFAAGAVVVVAAGAVVFLSRGDADPAVPITTTTVVRTVATSAQTVATTPTAATSTDETIESAGSAFDVGWRVAEAPEGATILGRLATGTWVAGMPRTFRGSGVNTAHLEVVWTSDDLETWMNHETPFADEWVVLTRVNAGTLTAWTASSEQRATQDVADALWLSSDGADWIQVVSMDMTVFPDRSDESLFFWFEALNFASDHRLLRDADRLIILPGGYTSTDGRIGVMDLAAETNQVVDPVEDSAGTAALTWAWTSDEGFHLIRDGRELWWSRDGLDWSMLGEVTGLPGWPYGGTGDWTPGDNQVLVAPDGRLVLVDADPSTMHAYESLDEGRTWGSLARPEFGAWRAWVRDRWMHVIGIDEKDAGAWSLWVSDDGRSWYSVDAIDVGFWDGTIEVGGGNLLPPAG